MQFLKLFFPEGRTKVKCKDKYVQRYSQERYNFETISVEDIHRRSGALPQMYSNEVDGFLVKHFLTEAEVDTIMSNFGKVLNDDPASTKVGFTYPTIFAEFSGRLRQVEEDKRQDATNAYFEKNSHFNRSFGDEFGVDVKGRIENLFRSIASGKGIEVATGMNGRGHYPFATFRLLVPEKGLMSIHCGNYFGKTFEVSYEDLTKKVAVENQMSYFIMLQEPDAGGELSLFNFRWKPGQTKANPTEDNEIIQPDGSVMRVEGNNEITKDKITPGKGDLIIFQGGNIWHRVEKVRGATPRITLGGFMGISVDQQNFLYWS